MTAREAAERLRARRSSSAHEKAPGFLDRAIFNVPARLMQPRLTVIAVTALLVCFGLVMIYSASSVEALSETGSASYYVVRQAELAVAGLVFAVALAKFDYHVYCRGPVLVGSIVFTAAVLLVVRFAGSAGGGATRWLQLGPIRLQPSEFAKITIIWAMSSIADDLLSRRVIGLGTALLRGLLLVGVPLVLILLQPDKGTTMIIFATLLVILVAAGLSMGIVYGFGGIAGVIFLFIGVASEYSRKRIVTMLNPWSDMWGDGYQLTRGFIALGSGGLFGTGLGMSRMKYSYLPEAHNDLIFAVIGEELGLLGTLAVLLAFFVLAREGLKIAKNASDSLGRNLATGCVAIIMIQMCLNLFGVLGWFPLSGKPLPFISYGGSSIMSCLMLVGVLVGVSVHSALPETVHDERRRAMALADEDTGVGEARPRGASPRRLGAATYAEPRAGRASTRSVRGGSTPLGRAGSSAEETRSRFRVVEGGAGGGRDRIDLGPSAAERLRPSDGPRVRERGATVRDAAKRPNGRRGRR